jgi:hypothetical protein
MTTNARAFAERLEDAGVPYELLEEVIRSWLTSRERLPDGALPPGVLGELDDPHVPAALAGELAALGRGVAHTDDLDRAVEYLVTTRAAWEAVRWKRTRLARWDRFPVGCALDGGRFEITERLRGVAARGQFRATRPGEEATALVTVGTAQARPLAELVAALAWQGSGIAPLRVIEPIAGGERELVAMVEDEPPGMPSDQLMLPVAPAAAARLARQVADALAELHASAGAVRFLRPELVYVDDGGGGPQLTALVPRAEAFLAGASPCYGVPSLFDAVYAAPEVLGLGVASAPADVFSLAAVVGYWVTGEHPFEGATPVAQMGAIAAGRGRLWSGPVALGMVLADALDPDPAARPPLGDLVRGLERAGWQS